MVNSCELKRDTGERNDLEDSDKVPLPRTVLLHLCVYDQCIRKRVRVTGHYFKKCFH